MLFQTYVRFPSGHWRKFDPYPEIAAEAVEVIRVLRELIQKKETINPYTHICAMPVSWAFA